MDALTLPEALVICTKLLCGSFLATVFLFLLCEMLRNLKKGGK